MSSKNLTYTVYRAIKLSLLKNTTAWAVPLVREYSFVSPQKVSPPLSVPTHIVKPQYVEQELMEPKGPVVEIKSGAQIRGMKETCQLARKILTAVSKEVKTGVTTDVIDKRVHELCLLNNAYPSPLQYLGFPKSVCTSVNNVACHGIPDSRPLEDGDIINIDITVFYNGFHGDVSDTYLVGNVDSSGQQLVKVAKECLDTGVDACQPGARFSDIGNAISLLAESKGFGIIPVFCGHGIGSYFHGPPDIFHVAYEDDALMKEGMTFTIEPIITEGSTEIKILADGWTAVSVDSSRSAQFEHTVLITRKGVAILT